MSTPDNLQSISARIRALIAKGADAGHSAGAKVAGLLS